jgi:hypothetical protein
MFTSPLIEEKVRVQSELSARCSTMAEYLAHNEQTAKKLAADRGFVLRYRVPEGFRPPNLNDALLEQSSATAWHLNDKG